MTGGAPSSPSLSGGRAGEGTGSGWMRKRPHALSLQAHLTQELSLVSIAASSQGCSPALTVEPWQAGMGRPRSLPGIRKDRACQNSTAVMLLATVTRADAQASSQHIQEGIPTPLTPLSPEAWHPPIHSARFGTASLLKAEVISGSKYGPSDPHSPAEPGASWAPPSPGLGSCGASLRRNSCDKLAPSSGTIRSLWQSRPGILPSDHSRQLPVLWK